MEIRENRSTTVNPTSKGMLLTGRIITGIVFLFLLFDAIMKIIREPHSVEGSVKLGWPDQSVSGLGVTLLICTIFYIIPRTAILGAILITAYLGGAVAIMFRVGEPFYFPIIFGILTWSGVYLRDEKLRQLMPLKKA